MQCTGGLCERSAGVTGGISGALLLLCWWKNKEETVDGGAEYENIVDGAPDCSCVSGFPESVKGERHVDGVQCSSGNDRMLSDGRREISKGMLETGIDAER